MQPGNQHSEASRLADQRAQAILTVITWLARTGGPVSHRAAAVIAEFAVKHGGVFTTRLHEALRDCESIGFEELRLAFATVLAMPINHRNALLSACGAVAFADGTPSPATEIALRFVADTCASRADEAETMLARTFERHAARLKPPGDPTSFAWWSGRGERRLGEQTEAGLLTARGLNELRDLATLGLMPDADDQEIRDAFRELARQYHPDRFHEKPDEVRQRALIHFRRVREAYERLLPE